MGEIQIQFSQYGFFPNELYRHFPRGLWEEVKLPSELTSNDLVLVEPHIAALRSEVDMMAYMALAFAQIGHCHCKKPFCNGVWISFERTWEDLLQIAKCDNPEESCLCKRHEILRHLAEQPTELLSQVEVTVIIGPIDSEARREEVIRAIKKVRR